MGMVAGFNAGIDKNAHFLGAAGLLAGAQAAVLGVSWLVASGLASGAASLFGGLRSIVSGVSSAVLNAQAFVFARLPTMAYTVANAATQILGGYNGNSVDCAACEDNASIATRMMLKNGGSVTSSLNEVNSLNLGEARNVDVVKQMYGYSGRGIGGVQVLEDGTKLILSRRKGPDQGVILMGSGGKMRMGIANIVETGNKNDPLRAVNIRED